jgi:hypothetical protein
VLQKKRKLERYLTTNYSVKLWKYSIMKMLSGFLDAQKTEGRKGSGF